MSVYTLYKYIAVFTHLRRYIQVHLWTQFRALISQKSSSHLDIILKFDFDFFKRLNLLGVGFSLITRDCIPLEELQLAMNLYPNLNPKILKEKMILRMILSTWEVSIQKNGKIKIITKFWAWQNFDLKHPMIKLKEHIDKKY